MVFRYSIKQYLKYKYISIPLQAVDCNQLIGINEINWTNVMTVVKSSLYILSTRGKLFISMYSMLVAKLTRGHMTPYTWWSITPLGILLRHRNFLIFDKLENDHLKRKSQKIPTNFCWAYLTWPWLLNLRIFKGGKS